MKQLIFLLVTITLIQSCNTGTKPDSLEEKKALLASLSKEMSDLKNQIEKLETEIAAQDTGKQAAAKAKRVGVDTVRISDFAHYVTVQGSVDAEYNVLAAPQMPGVVTAILVQVGQKVSKGQTLAQLDNSVILNGMEELRTGLELATTAYEKQKRLWEQNIGSEIQYLTAKNQKEQLERKMQTLNAQLDMTRIKAPVSGVVDEIKLKVGEMASPGYFGVRVVNMEKLSVKAKLGDAFLGKVKAGDKVQLHFPDIDKTIESTVTYVSQQVDRQSRTITVEVKLDNKDGEYRANMIAELMINDANVKQALVIPSNVIQHSVDGSFIMLAENNNGRSIARKRPVVTGLEYNGSTVITEGLAAGDCYISFGYNEVVDGQLIAR